MGKNTLPRIQLTLGGDHGGSSFKQLLNIRLNEEDREETHTLVGIYHAKDRQDIFDNTLFSKLKSSYESIKNSKLLICEDKYSNNYVCLLDQQMIIPEQVDLLVGATVIPKIGFNDKTFDVFFSNSSCEILKKKKEILIDVYHQGDLKNDWAMLNGKTGCSGHYCIVCGDQIKKKSKLNNQKALSIDTSVNRIGIERDNYIIPYLHCVLRLGLDLIIDLYDLFYYALDKDTHELTKIKMSLISQQRRDIEKEMSEEIKNKKRCRDEFQSSSSTNLIIDLSYSQHIKPNRNIKQKSLLLKRALNTLNR